MTPHDVRDEVRAIEVAHRHKGKWDHESAHSAEKAMWRAVLEAIASGRAMNPRACAMYALSSEDLDFNRRFA